MAWKPTGAPALTEWLFSQLPDASQMRLLAIPNNAVCREEESWQLAGQAKCNVLNAHEREGLADPILTTEVSRKR
jgi:hypothetical protein